MASTVASPGSRTHTDAREHTQTAEMAADPRASPATSQKHGASSVDRAVSPAPAPASSWVPFAGCALSPRIRSYLFEWLLTVIVILLPLAIAYFFIPFRNKTISLLDPTIQQPYYKADSLPILGVFIPTVAVPLICFVAYPLALSRSAERMGLPPHPFSWHYTYWWSSCLVQTVGLTVLLSELMKRLIQAPRPDFLGRCFPHGIPAEVQAQAAANNYIVHTDQCTVESNSIFEDGLQAMPSEHTSLAFCMTTVLILFFWTLRRELIAHASRLGRQARAAQRDALVARLVASGVPPRRAHKLATGASSGGSDSATCVDRAKRIDVCASPDLRPPTLIEPVLPPSPEKLLAQSETHDTKQGHIANGTQGANGPAAAAAAASASSDSSASTLSAPVPTEAQVPHESGRVSGPRAEVPLGGSMLTAAQAPSPSVVSFWPHSHVVYIAHMLFPIGWAISVGLSRTFDHRHSFPDVVVGGVLGVVVALAVYRMHLVKFEGYHQRWNGFEGREQKDMDDQAADRQRRSQAAQRLLEEDDEGDEENQLQQHVQASPMMQFDGAALGPAAPQRDDEHFTVQLHQPRPLSNSQAPVLAPQESKASSMELPLIRPMQTTAGQIQLPSRTHSREQDPDPAVGRNSFSNGPVDLSHTHDADQLHDSGKMHTLPGRAEELRALNNV